MTDEVKILNSKDAIPARTDPTGVVYNAFREGEACLWSLWAVREDELGKTYPNKKRTQPVQGDFTSESRALDALRRWLTVRWSESDAESARLAARNEPKATRT